MVECGFLQLLLQMGTNQSEMGCSAVTEAWWNHLFMAVIEVALGVSVTAEIHGDAEPFGQGGGISSVFDADCGTDFAACCGSVSSPAPVRGVLQFVMCQ